jgi:hypothetical protein
MWNFDYYPSFIEAALDGIPNYWVGVVRSIDQLDVEITNLLARHQEESLRSGSDGRLSPPVLSQPDMNHDWIHSSTPY